LVFFFWYRRTKYSGKGSPPVIGKDGKVVVSQAAKWKAEKKKKKKEYNKSYYVKKKGLKKEPEKEHEKTQWEIDKETCELVENNRTTSHRTISGFFGLEGPIDQRIVKWEKDLEEHLQAVKADGF